MKLLSVFSVALLATTCTCCVTDAASIQIFSEDFSVDDSTVHNGNRFGGIRRANNGGSHFVDNWVFTQTGFGGIDQVRSSGDPGILANNGVVTTGIAYANVGSDGGTPSVNGGSQNETDDTLPSGAFLQTISAGDTISYSLDVIDNNDNGIFDYEIALLLDGETDLANRFTVVADSYTGPVGSVSSAIYTTITGTSGPLPAAMSFNVVAIANNDTGTGAVDQVGIDDIVLTLNQVPEPTSLALGLFGLLGLGLTRKRS